MKRLIISGICFMGFVFILSSCAHHQTSSVAKDLDPADLYPMYKTKIIDLKSQSKCFSPPAVKLMNMETRNEDLLIAEIGGHTHYIKPKELTNHIVKYMDDALAKCQVKVDATSTKIIEVSIDKAEMKLSGPFSARGAVIQLKVNIPEKQYSNIYSAEEWSAQAIWTTMAYAIHRATWKFIDDPVIQDYILCR
jgi:hypothetical protein